MPHPAKGIKRQFAWSVLPLAATTVLNLFSVRYNIQFLGDELYALLGFIAMFTGMFGFADLGLGVAVGRYIGVALGKGDQRAVREYWGTANLIAMPLIGTMALAFGILGVFGGTHWVNVAPENVPLLRACFIAGATNLFFSYYGQFWVILSQAHLDFRFVGALKTVMVTLHIIPALILAWMTKNPVLITLWGTVVAFIHLVIYMWHVRRRFHLGFEFSQARRARFHEMASYTGKTFASLLVNNVFGSLDRVILSRFTPSNGTDYVNYNNAAANVGSRIQGVGGAIMAPVFHNTTRAVGGGRPAAPADIYNATFRFVFPWYLLAALVAVIWHPVLLRLWLGPVRGAQVSPVFAPVIIGFCISALAGVSNAQLAALNRMGTVLIFTALSGILAGIGTYVGWHLNGITGVGYGFLFSRIGLLAQDVYTLRLIKAGGWFSVETWKMIALQGLVAAALATVYLILPADSLWMLIPASFHITAMAVWFSRSYIEQLVGKATFFRKNVVGP